MTRPFLIALVCLGLACLTDSRASGDVLEVQAAYTWAGLAPTWPNHTFSILCSSGPDCAVKAVLLEGQPGSSPSKRCLVDARVPKAIVQALPAAAQTDLKAVPKPVELIGHTDDYPRWDVRIRSGNGSLRLLNTSNEGPKGTWNVQQSGRWSVQQSDAFDRAFKAVLEPVYKNAKSACPNR